MVPNRSVMRIKALTSSPPELWKVYALPAFASHDEMAVSSRSSTTSLGGQLDPRRDCVGRGVLQLLVLGPLAGGALGQLGEGLARGHRRVVVDGPLVSAITSTSPTG